ncbi:MAG: indole-3-glycerol phosphate synthase TrpC [Chloroflexota bacterium]
MTPGSIVDEIIASTAEAIIERKQLKPLETLERELVIVNQINRPRDFIAALQSKDLSLIAEIKRASPSRGTFPVKLSVNELAIAYASAGASAISVVTEPKYFHGSLSYLTLVRSAVSLPVLCKDFIIDPYQVYEARACGADAVLLIASILGSSRLQELLKLTTDLGMAALIEVHNIRDLEKALAGPARLIGINNRDLSTFNVTLETTLSLRPLVPAGITIVSESGIHSAQDVETLRHVGINAILVGESLVTSPDPALKLAELLGKQSGVRTANSAPARHSKQG